MLPVGGAGKDKEVPSAVVSDEQVALDPGAHWYVYDTVPPDGFAVRVTDWPLVIVGEDGVIAPAVRGMGSRAMPASAQL